MERRSSECNGDDLAEGEAVAMEGHGNAKMRRAIRSMTMQKPRDLCYVDGMAPSVGTWTFQCSQHRRRNKHESSMVESTRRSAHRHVPPACPWHPSRSSSPWNKKLRTGLLTLLLGARAFATNVTRSNSWKVKSPWKVNPRLRDVFPRLAFRPLNSQLETCGTRGTQQPGLEEHTGLSVPRGQRFCICSHRSAKPVQRSLTECSYNSK